MSEQASPVGALQGVLVIALEQAVAAPLATLRLAQAGARVIKIERQEGDFARGYDRAAKGLSSYFVWLNRGKQSLRLDLKAPDDLALLHRLIVRADIFVQNLAPGASARLGADAATLRARDQRLIVCDISSYGADGPYSARKGYDLLIQAESGLASVTGLPEAPGRIGVSACDIAAGMNAHAAILEALLVRARTGQGAALEISLFDAAAEWMTVPLLQYDSTGINPVRIGLSHASIAPYGAYDLADGGQILIAIQNEREWLSFCTAVLDQPGLAMNPEFVNNVARVANRSALDAAIRPCFAALSRARAEVLLSAANIAFGAINTTADLARHPHLRRVSVPTEMGPVEIPASPVLGLRRDTQAVPALGEDGDRIRQEFGN